MSAVVSAGDTTYTGAYNTSYNTFERPPAYSDSDKNAPYQGTQQPRHGQYYPLPNEPLQAPHHQTNLTVVHQQPVVVCRATVVCDRPNNHLVASIINFMCCCWCLGLIALIYSLRVDSDYAAGRISDAIEASLMARRLNRIGFLLGTLIIVAIAISVTLGVIHNNDDDDYDYNNYNN